MKAIINHKYGTPDILELSEVKRPDPADHQVLVKILAASVNKGDWHILTGAPLPVRLMSGLFKPKYRILGADIAGTVEQVGSKVSQFKVGDEVFGDLSATGFGGFAEFALADEHRIALKPTNLSFEESAALLVAAITALQALRDKGRIMPGQHVLINGASGGVGTYAIQLAKALGARVSAVCSTGKIEMARNLGADDLIDYSDRDYTRETHKYDLIIDVVGNHTVSSNCRVLKSSGRYVTSVFSMGVLLTAPWKSITENKKLINLLADTNRADLQFLSKLAEEERLVPYIESTYTLDDVPDALHRMGLGKNAGKLVISI